MRYVGVAALIVNVLIIIAALIIFYTGSPWADWVVGFSMGLLAIMSAKEIMQMAEGQLGHHH